MYHDTPLMVRGVLYTVTSLGQIAAIDPASGQTRWIFDPESWKIGRPGNLGFVHRGLAYWSDGTSERLLLGTADAYLIAMDAKTGQLDVGLRRWRAGRSHGRRGAGRARNATSAVSPRPIVVRGVVVVGSSIHDGPTHKEWPRGDVMRLRRPDRAPIVDLPVRSRRRASSATTRGRATRRPTRAAPTSGRTCPPTRSSASSTCRSARRPTTSTAGIARVTTCSPRAWWRSRRAAASGVALPAGASRRLGLRPACRRPPWSTSASNGRAVKAIAQVTKQGFTYVFDRRTGRPVWPIEERPVPQSTVPGERTSATQPFPYQAAGRSSARA